MGLGEGDRLACLPFSAMLPGICNVIPLAAVCDRVRRSPALLMLSVEVASAFSFAFGSSSSPEVKIFGRYLLMDDVRRGVLGKGKTEEEESAGVCNDYKTQEYINTSLGSPDSAGVGAGTEVPPMRR